MLLLGAAGAIDASLRRGVDGEAHRDVAGFGSALGTIILYLAEILSGVDILAAVEGAIVVVVTGLIAYIVPPTAPEPGGPGSRQS